MSEHPKMGELISAIEAEGIHVRSAKWEEGNHLNIDVADEDRERASEACQQYWLRKQGQRLIEKEKYK